MRRGVMIGVFIGAGALVFAACSSNSSGGGTTTTASSKNTATTVGVQSGGNLTFALDENLAGFNVNTSASSEFVLQEILDVVWPQVFITNPQLEPELNTQLMQSATQTSTSPQTIVYTINPKAVWQDGTPIDAADFVYNYDAQSGKAAYKDVGGKPFDDASTVGYNQIQTITGSNPPNGGTCTTTTLEPTLPPVTCGNGDTVTVVFAKPFADWKSLFGDIVPEHIATTIPGGWSTGFNTAYTKVLSGSWYEIKSYSPNQSLVLQRNPKYWATPGKLSTITFSFISDDSQEVPALQNNEVNLINPASVSLSIVQSADQVTGIQKQTIPGLEFEHFDFNEANYYLGKLAVRQAIAYGTNRQQIIQRTVGLFASGISPLGNRMLMPNQPGYVNNGTAYGTVNDAKAEQLLSGLGYTKGSDGYYQPNAGPEAGQDLTLTISSTTGNTLRQDTEELFQAQMKAIGIKIKIQNYDADTFFGTNLPTGNFEIGEFAWVSTPFLSGNEAIYCSYTNTTECADNWNHFANSQVDTDVFNGASATDQATETADYNAADALLWANMDTLPLYQKPQFYAWTDTYGNVIPNASSTGVPWNANLWGMKTS
ncbi:MAG: ABC transporter family substrate-binding protein [Acidimicrobiales bacterium]